jgi:hypothetical protein
MSSVLAERYDSLRGYCAEAATVRDSGDRIAAWQLADDRAALLLAALPDSYRTPEPADPLADDHTDPAELALAARAQE